LEENGKKIIITVVKEILHDSCLIAQKMLWDISDLVCPDKKVI
jgi:hypothetical protein